MPALAQREAAWAEERLLGGAEVTRILCDNNSRILTAP